MRKKKRMMKKERVQRESYSFVYMEQAIVD